MKRAIFALLAVLALSAVASTASADKVIVVPDGVGVSDAISAVNTDVGIYVKFIGNCQPVTTSTVAVAAGGILSFVACGVADATINPVAAGPLGICGNTAGSIDPNDADCNTFGELIDLINGSPNWVAYPGAVLRTDSSDNTLDTLVAAPAQYGLGLLKDTAVALNVTLAPRPLIGTAQAHTFGLQGNILNPNPFRGIATYIYRMRENITSAGVIGNFAVFGVTQDFLPKQTAAANTLPAQSYRETARTAWAQTGAATTVELALNFADNPVVLNPGERPLIRQSATVGLTVPLLNVTGVARTVSVP
jgi:hypothetical protein